MVRTANQLVGISHCSVSYPRVPCKPRLCAQTSTALQGPKQLSVLEATALLV